MTIRRLQGVSILNPRVIGTTHQACELALLHGVTRVVVASLDYPRQGQHGLPPPLQDLGHPGAGRGSSYYEELTGKVMIEGLRKSWLIFSDGFVVSRGVLFAKRLLDLTSPPRSG